MLPQPLCWDSLSEHVIYSRIHKDLRKVYKYDIFTEMSGPINFYDLTWFEFEPINDDQIIIHGWKKGIYVHDLEDKHSQKLVAAEDSRWFHFLPHEKKLLYSNGDHVYMFDPDQKKSVEMIRNSAELIIDKVHQTFITVSQGLNPTIDIYYKNEKIITFQNGFNIVCSLDFRFLLFFEENQDDNLTKVNVINLETLELHASHDFDGIVQSVNRVGDILHFSILNESIYELYTYDFSSHEIHYHDSRKSDFQIYSSLSDNMKYIALLHDEDGNSYIELIELEKSQSNLLN